MFPNRFRLANSFSSLFHGSISRIPYIQQFLKVLSKHSMATAMGRRLEGKTILITGASSGIGASIGYRPLEIHCESSGLTSLSYGICAYLSEKPQAYSGRKEG